MVVPELFIAKVKAFLCSTCKSLLMCLKDYAISILILFLPFRQKWYANKREQKRATSTAYSRRVSRKKRLTLLLMAQARQRMPLHVLRSASRFANRRRSFPTAGM